MLILQSRTDKPRRRLIKRLIWISVPLLVLAAWLAWTPAMTQYHLWKQKNALEQAKGFIAQHDANDAHLALEVAFTVAPGNIDAWRTAADMLEQVGTPEALRLRRHVADMMGSTLADRVALVNTALHFRDFNAARDALASISTDQADQPAALGAALSFALATQNAPIADALFDRMKKRMPNNEDFVVAQAILHLRNPNPPRAEEARKLLEGYAANPKYTLRVERELTGDAMVRNDLPAAKHWAAQAAANPNAVLQDRLHVANLDLLVDKKPFEQVFPPLAAAAAKSVSDAVPFVHWLLVQGRAAKADEWLATLPAETRKDPAIVKVEADVVTQLKDWDRLAALVQAGAWGPINGESLRLAMSARVVGAHNPTLQHEIWAEAIQAANGNLVTFLALERLTNIWKWEAESEQTLWTIARAFPDQTWAHQELFNFYRSHNDTTNMREVMNVLRTADGSVPRYRHDWALLSMLLDHTTDWNEPKEMMRQLYKEDPANSNYATGYAFALARAGKGAEALAVVAKFSPTERDYSPRAPYLAYVYGINGKKDDLAHAESLAQHTSYLPEERLLFALAHEAQDRKLRPAPAAAAKPKPNLKS